MTTLLQVRDLTKHFPLSDGVVKAVDGVSFDLGLGETLGIVGESGCGKSTLARLITRLIEPSAGDSFLEGESMAGLSRRALRRRRRDIQLIFQDPFASLDPRQRVGSIVAEPLEIHGVGTRAERTARVAELLERVGLDEDSARRYPHEFSGGQRQRIGIARGIALHPKLVIADEPVSALDVSIQSQILNLLMDLKADLGLSYIFISHDLSVVEHISDRVAVMYLGRIVEIAPAERIYDGPLHPYTQALVSAIPVPDPERPRERIVLTGDIPSPEDPPPGCPFHPRCRHAFAPCASVDPPLQQTEASAESHLVRCHLFA